MVGQKSQYVPLQGVLGLPVIDIRGILVGSVKDIGVNVKDKDLVLIVATKAKAEVEVAWGDISSMHDVVLLNKELEVPKEEASQAPQPTPTAVSITCPACGTLAPAHAKFCPKCGRSLHK